MYIDGKIKEKRNFSLLPLPILEEVLKEIGVIITLIEAAIARALARRWCPPPPPPPPPPSSPPWGNDFEALLSSFYIVQHHLIKDICFILRNNKLLNVGGVSYKLPTTGATGLLLGTPRQVDNYCRAATAISTSTVGSRYRLPSDRSFFLGLP